MPPPGGGAYLCAPLSKQKGRHGAFCYPKALRVAEVFHCICAAHPPLQGERSQRPLSHTLFSRKKVAEVFAASLFFLKRKVSEDSPLDPD